MAHLTEAEGARVLIRLLELAGIEPGHGAQRKLAALLGVTGARVSQISRGELRPDSVADLFAQLGDPNLKVALERLERAKLYAVLKAIGVERFEPMTPGDVAVNTVVDLIT